MSPVAPLLSVEDLVVDHRSGAHTVKAVAGVSFTVGRGETVALVGESGCGKSTLARTIVGLHRPTSGRIRFGGQDLTSGAGGFLAGRRNPVRRRLQMVFQDPLLSLNPRATVGRIIEEPLIVQKQGDSATRRQRVDELLGAVGLSPDMKTRLPHEFSGGQRQRIGIARALALRPDLVVCDEPVSALDLSLQAQILNLLSDLQERMALSYLFISHDLSVVRHIADRILVMYLGRIVESGPIDILGSVARHPYTQTLNAAVPGARAGRRAAPLENAATSDVPSPIDRPSGCFFHTRCPHRRTECVERTPVLRQIAPGHEVACHLVEAGLELAPPAARRTA